MLSLDKIINILKEVRNNYKDLKVGVAGSYVNNSATDESDIDVILEGDSTNMEVIEYIKNLFDIEVDVLWLNLLRQEDEELDAFSISQGLPTNPYSVYKTVMKEVIWV